MRRVITVSLNGNAYQLDEDAYAVLAAYLDESARALATNPDKDEIIADLEQAIADKCGPYLNAHKSVVARAELAQVIAEMGPVDGAAPEVAAAAGAPGADTPSGPAPADPAAGAAPSAARRLYQISDGAIVSGVCKGIAAYFAVDVTLVRVIFVVLVIATFGAALLGYLILMFVVPYASTSEEHAAAHGLPFNARVLVERAKQEYAQFANRSDWRRSRHDAKYWRRQARAEWRAHRHAFRHAYRRWGAFGPPVPPAAAGSPTPPTAYASHVLTGTLLAVLGLFLTIFSIGWFLALLSLVMTGAIFGWPMPHDVPVWVAIVALIVAYNLIAWPIKAARHAAYFQASGYHGSALAPLNGLLGLAVLATLIWYGYHHVPELHALIDHLTQMLNSLFDRNGDRTVAT
jgi:phage shock protein PspC (stress-responsive transcriptional regulator)